MFSIFSKKNNIGNCKSRKNINRNVSNTNSNASGSTNSTTKSINNTCKKKYNKIVQEKLKEFNEDKITSLNDNITELRTKYSHNSFSDTFIEVNYGGIIQENGKYIYQCSLNFEKLFNILLYTTKNKNGTNLTEVNGINSDQVREKKGIKSNNLKLYRERTLGNKIVAGVKTAIKDKLNPSSKDKNVLKMDNIYWGNNENSNILYMNMNIEKFYKEVLINKKILPKIRLSKKSISEKLINPSIIASAVVGSRPNLAELVKLEKTSYQLTNNEKDRIKLLKKKK